MFLKIILVAIVWSLSSIFLYRHIGLIILSSFKKKKKSVTSNHQWSNNCDILIASHNEWKHLIKVIESILQQKGWNQIHIRVLLKDRDDNSYIYIYLQSFLEQYSKTIWKLWDTYLINNEYSTTLHNLLQSLSIQTHNYRENIIDLSWYIDTNHINDELYFYIGIRNKSKFLLTEKE